jgi:membrane protein DedA with SNARE-associated domain
LEAFLDSVTAWSWLVYLLAFAVVLVESAGAPIPGLTLVLAAAGLAGQGRLEIWLVVLATVAGGAAGGMIGYLIGQQGGRRLLERFGRYVFITPQRLELGERGFQQHGSKVVLLGRYTPIFCFLAGVLAGMARMPVRRYALFNLLSICLWSTTQLTLAFIFGKSLDVLLQVFNNVGLALIVAVAIVGAGVYFIRWRRRALARRHPVADPLPVRSGE